MSKKITFTVPDNPTIGDVQKAIIKMMKRNWDKDSLITITHFIDLEFGFREEEDY